jgi:hypothetical protein
MFAKPREDKVMFGASKFTLIAVLALVFCRPVIALAAPVTDADLRGKTVCWSYGGTRNTYGKDGSFDSNLVGHGTWRLVADRLTEDGDHGVYTFTISKEGQTLHMYGRTPGGGSVEVWGRYCN